MLLTSLVSSLLGALAFGQQIEGLTFSPNLATGGGAFTGTVTLTKAAGSSGLKITLVSASKSVATVPASVTVASGHASGYFTGSAALVTADASTKITATDPTNKAVSTALSVVPPAVRIIGLSVAPTSVVASESSTATVTLSNEAPSSGLVIKLASNEAYAKVPAGVTVKSGAKTATFTVGTIAVASNGSAAITGTDPTGYKASANLAVTVPSIRLTGLSISPSTVTAANPATATLELGADAPTGGFPVKLSTSQTYIGIPATVTVPAGAHSTTFTVLTKPVTTAGTATVTATDPYGYVSAADLTVKIPASRISKIAISPSSVVAPAPATGTVTLTAAAPAGGVAVYVSTMQSYIGVPMKVTVIAGATTATFTITTQSVSNASTATVEAQDVNGYPASATLTVNPSPPAVSMTSQFSFSPQSLTVPAGTKVTFTNVSEMSHTASSDVSVQTINSGPVGPSGVYTWTVPANAASGTKFYYHCQYHGNAGNGASMGTGMAGVIIVK